MLCVIAYDITSDRRRQKVADLLRSHGIPVQLSLVECELNATQLVQIRQQLSSLIHPRRDRIAIYPLCPRCRRMSIQLGEPLVHALRNL